MHTQLCDKDSTYKMIGPSGAVLVLGLGLNFVGDAIRDALDPRIRV